LLRKEIEISIIILNYNTTDHLKKLLNSVVKYLNINNYEIIVADNNSNDKSILNLNKEFNFIKFISIPENIGFASGNNYAVKYSTAKYLLFINPDIELVDNSLEKLPGIYSREENAGIISGLLINKNNTVQYCFNDFPDLSWEFFLMIGKGYNRKIKKLTHRKEISQNINFDVDWFHGAFLFMEKNIYDKIGGFNENYFMYYEDVELCYKVKKKLKKRIICVPAIRVNHITKSSIKANNTDDLYYFHINRGKLIFFENYNYFHSFILKSIFLFSIVIRLAGLPFWSKFKGMRKNKYDQLVKILGIFFSKRKLYSSKYEYISK